MYEVFGGVASRAFRVLWLLDEMGVEFVHHDLKAGSDEMKAVNPSGKVPALKVDGELITDSAAIMTFWLISTASLPTLPGQLNAQSKMLGFIRFWTRSMPCFGRRRGTRLFCLKSSACLL